MTISDAAFRACQELENALLREQVTELRETIRAIRDGEVDALIVEKDGAKKVFTLQGADHVYQEVVEGMSEGALTFDNDGLILYSNQFFRDMVGLPVRDLVGTFVQDHFVSTGFFPLSVLMADARFRRTRGEILLKTASGKQMPTLISMRQLDLEGLQVFCGVVTDLTLTKEYEEARVRTIELTRSNQELGQFAYVSSHDLQEPLRKISTYAQLLESNFSGKLGAAGQKYISNIADSTHRMQLLIKALLSYSQLGEARSPDADVDLGSIVAQAVSDLEISIRDTGATFTVAELPVVMGDAVRLRQVVQHLISNAIKFRGEAPPVITITARRDYDEWIVSFQDNGIGIEPNYFDQIFKVFNRLHTRTAFDGTGMGLAICKKIIEQHRGRISVTSTPGSGSTFSFSIPA